MSSPEKEKLKDMFGNLDRRVGSFRDHFGAYRGCQPSCVLRTSYSTASKKRRCLLRDQAATVRTLGPRLQGSAVGCSMQKQLWKWKEESTVVLSAGEEVTAPCVWRQLPAACPAYVVL